MGGELAQKIGVGVGEHDGLGHQGVVAGRRRGHALIGKGLDALEGVALGGIALALGEEAGEVGTQVAGREGGHLGHLETGGAGAQREAELGDGDGRLGLGAAALVLAELHRRGGELEDAEVRHNAQVFGPGLLHIVDDLGDLPAVELHGLVNLLAHGDVEFLREGQGEGEHLEGDNRQDAHALETKPLGQAQVVLETLGALLIGHDVIAELQDIHGHVLDCRGGAVGLHPGEPLLLELGSGIGVVEGHLVDDLDAGGAAQIRADLADLLLEAELAEVLGLLVAVEADAPFHAHSDLPPSSVVVLSGRG